MPAQEYQRELREARRRKVEAGRKDCYSILGVERGASPEEVKKGYRREAVRHHPDKHSGASEEERREHEVGRLGVIHTFTIKATFVKYRLLKC